MKTLTLFFTICLFVSTAARAQIPQTLSYQGILTDAQGNSVPDGAIDLTCRLYEEASGGNPLWEEIQQITVTGGVFSTILGSATVLNLPFDKPYWLGLAINGDSELEPRTALTAAAYSLFAESIADSSVTPTKIADGVVVRSVNGTQDAVNIMAGDNVNITKQGGDIVISADATGGAGNGVPIGTVIDWWRPNDTFPVPAGFQICDGGKVTDSDSPLNGQNLPDLIGVFVRGVALQDIGKVGGSSSHKHSVDPPMTVSASAGGHSHTVNPPATATTSAGAHLHAVDPPNYSDRTDPHSHIWAFYEGSANKWKSYRGGGSLFTFRDYGDGIDGTGSGFFPLETNDRTTTLFTEVREVPFSVDISQFNSSSAGLHIHSVNISEFNTGNKSNHSHNVDPDAFDSASRSHTPNYVGLLKIMRVK